MIPGIRENVPLAPMTTLRVGGPARYFLDAEDGGEIESALQWSVRESLPVFILGGGSNLVVSDDGFPGLVIRVALRGRVIESEDDDVIVRVAAGESWDDFVAYTVENGWAGVTCLSGIPGSVGATPIQNVGAYGQDVAETIVRVEALERKSGLVRFFTKWDCGFSYRDSYFKRQGRDEFVILGVTFALTPGGSASIKYPELEKELAAKGVFHDDLRGVRNTVIEIRRRKGMVLDAADPDTRSDGSFFVNPIVEPSRFAQFESRARAIVGEGIRIPSFPADEGFKLSAAWLIENAGFEKGFSYGNAAISTKHTLALTNRGGATAREILDLARMIRDGVADRFGVTLVPEPNLVGFPDNSL